MSAKEPLKQPQPFEHLTRQVKANPSGIALQSNEGSFTYRDAFDHSKKIAALLRQRGVKPGQVVATQVSPHLNLFFFEALFHEAAIGCIYAGPTSDLEIVDWVLSTSKLPEVPDSKTILIDQDFLAAAAMLSSVIEPKAFDSFDSICRLVYSSGTTGTPKATAFSISLIESRVATALENWLLHDSVISVLPMSGITGTLAAYANVALGKTYFAPGNASENFELISNYQIAEVVASPAQLGDLVKNAIAASQNLNSLELIVPAGSMLSEQLAKALLEVAPNARLMNLYGCSELGTIATKREPDFNPANMGRIAPGVEVQIVSQARQVLESGSEGILRFKTTDIAGYFRNPQANSEAFKDGWFYPGDIGFVTPDNHLMLLGRSIEVLNVGGVKINPDQLDGILKTVAGVQDAAAFSYRTPTGTDGLAYAVVEGEGFEPQQLIAAVQETFVALVPTAICSVAQIPRTATSKVLRKALAEAFERNL